MSTSQDQSVSPPSSSDASAAARGPLAFLIVGVGAVLLLGGLSLLNKKPAAAAKDISQLAVLVEFESLSATTRASLGALQKGLVALPGIRVRGPLDCPLLLPGTDADMQLEENLPPHVKAKLGNTEKPDKQLAKGRKIPQFVRFDLATETEFKGASHLFSAGGYLIPRMLAPDRKSAIFRLAPSGQPKFAPTTLEALRQLLKEHVSELGGTTLYSKSLGLVEAAAREKINGSFGTQTIWVVLESTEGTLSDPAVLDGIEQAIRGLNDPQIRAVASDAGYYRYSHAVHVEDVESSTPFQTPKVVRRLPGMLFVAQQTGYPLLTSADGKRTFIEISTTAEGKAAVALEKACALKFGKIPGVKAFANHHKASAKK